VVWRYDADDWDRQIASDGKSGKLTRLEPAPRDHEGWPLDGM